MGARCATWARQLATPEADKDGSEWLMPDRLDQRLGHFQ